MSVAINPVQSHFVGRQGVSAVVPPTEVWDVERGGSRVSSNYSVRTLTVQDRKDERSVVGSDIDLLRDENLFESRRETRDTVLLGVCMTAALLIGSAFGGVFSGAGEAAGVATGSEAAAVSGAGLR